MTLFSCVLNNKASIIGSVALEIIRGQSSLTGPSLALFELNGTRVDQSAVEDIPTSNIASIKVVKGNNAFIYGIRGVQGMISPASANL